MKKKTKVARQRRYETSNIGKGLCAVCPDKLDEASKRFCTKHLKKNRKAQQRFQKKRFGKVK